MPLSVQVHSAPEKVLQFLQPVVEDFQAGVDLGSLKHEPAYATADLFFELSDLDQDSLPDLVVSAVIPPDDPLAPGGFFGSWVVSDCGGQGFQITAISGSSSGYECEGDSCSLRTTLGDFLGTGQRQVLVVASYYFVNRGGSRMTLTGWHGDRWEELMDEEPDIDPVRSLVAYDADQDGIKEISVWGYEAGTTALEPARPSYSTYKWNPNEGRYVLNETKRMPPTFEYQILDDAQRELDSGNIQYSIALYLFVAEQPSQVVPSFWERDQAFANSMSDDSLLAEAEAYQTAFATFRLIYLYEFVGEPLEAQSSLHDLEQWASPDQPGQEFSEIARQMLDELAQGSLLLEACQDAVHAGVLKYPHLIGPEGHIGDWGNTSTFYTESNVCPDLE